jgi:hypothetical protein
MTLFSKVDKDGFHPEAGRLDAHALTQCTVFSSATKAKYGRDRINRDDHHHTENRR